MFQMYNCDEPAKVFSMMLSILANLTKKEPNTHWKEAYVEVRSLSKFAECNCHDCNVLLYWGYYIYEVGFFSNAMSKQAYLYSTLKKVENG